MATSALNTSAFIAKLLTPVPGVMTPDMFTGANLSKEIRDIREAQAMVAKLTKQRNAAPWGTRAYKVVQIMLDWWEQELGDLVGYHAEKLS